MCEQLEMRMRNLKTFSTTRFPNSVRAVFDTLIDDFEAVVKCLENIAYNDNDTGTDARKRADDAKGILRRILSKSFVLQLSVTSDHSSYNRLFPPDTTNRLFLSGQGDYCD